MTPHCAIFGILEQNLKCVLFGFWFLFFGCVKPAAISADMVKDGYQNIMNIDISAVVVEAMTAKYKDTPQLKCENSFEFLKTNMQWVFLFH